METAYQLRAKKLKQLEDKEAMLKRREQLEEFKYKRALDIQEKK